MKLLKERILKEGKVINNSILKVDSFLNHQIDPILMYEIGKEIYTRFKDYHITKLLTIEASGIACAVFAGYHFKLPVVFAKKQSPSTIAKDNIVSSKVFSFTKNREYEIVVAKDFIKANDRVLIIDDFLAHGNALRGLYEIVKLQDADVVGAAIVVEKSFQLGREKLMDLNIEIQSLSKIISLENNTITIN